MVNMWGRSRTSAGLLMLAGRLDQVTGVGMGRNIFQSDDPTAMIRAVGAVVHHSLERRAAFGRGPAGGST
jgi:hypothetical protein